VSAHFFQKQALKAAARGENGAKFTQNLIADFSCSDLIHHRIASVDHS
jgi:hypothetical protein